MEPDEVAQAIADNVRRLRVERRLTLEALADRADVSKGTVIQVEQARSNPNIATLCRLAEALGVGVASLIETRTSPRLLVRRKADAAPLWTNERGSRARFLIGTDPPTIIEVWDWHLEPGDAFDGDPHEAGTVEALTIRKGTLGLTVGERQEELRAGDSVLFEAYLPHRYANASPRAAVDFTMVVLQPSDWPLGPPDTIAEAG